MSLPEKTNVNRDKIITDATSISDNESISSKDFFSKASDIDRRLNKNAENNSEKHIKTESSFKLKRPTLSRAMFRNSRRMAALKRWETRKKNLCKSQRKNVSDSDSTVSNYEPSVLKLQSSSMKNKEIIRQKKMKTIQKQLKTDLAEKYIGFVDVDTPRTRLRKQSTSLVVSSNENNNIKTETTCFSAKNQESSVSLLAKNDVNDVKHVEISNAGKSILQTNNNTFTPKLSQSTLVIGKTTFIVRSNLILQDQHYSQILNSSKKNSDGFNGIVSQEKNTDIIEAVKLRRVNPAVLDVKDNVERCLDIRIESKELTKLKHMQVELSSFIEKEMKQNILGVKKTNETEDTGANNTNLQLKLEYNVKKLIQNAIEKNIESWIDEKKGAKHQEYKKILSKLVSATAHLPQYQPKVVLKRLNLARSINNNINMKDVLKQAAPRNKCPRKRLVVLPKKYDDFKTLNYLSELEDLSIPDKSRLACPRTYKNSVKEMRSKVMIKQQINNSTTSTNESNNSIVRVNNNKDAMPVSPLVKENLTNEQKDSEGSNETKDLTSTEFYMCSICKCTFNNKKDSEAHILTCRTTTNTSRVLPVNNNTVTSPQSKEKKMRCKKCHEIVDYKSIKTHISMCKMTTQIYVCYICDSNFHVKKLLLEHLETVHNFSQMTNTIETKETNNTSLESRVEVATSTTSQESQTVGLQLPTVSEALQKGLAIQTNKKGICIMPLKNHTNESNVQSTTMDVNNIQSDKITATNVKSDVARNVEKDKEYTCFLCDQIFTDEDMLKDHLQQHCDDLSDEEQNKDLHKCTICGNLLESSQALEEHICKHWFDGEGSSDMNSINLNDENTTEDSSTEDEIHQCSECWEMFNSQALLEMHTRVHVQEASTTKPDEQVGYQYLCMLCDDLLDTEKDLADHINLHNGNAQICQLCDKPFHTLEELQEHVMTHL